MRALSLFSGIGGIDLASEWAGIETVAFCEREPFCQKVLKKHWPHVPIYDDVCTLTKERLIEDGIIGTGGQLTLFTEDTLASLLVLPGSEKAREMTATSGRRLSAYYKRSDPIGLLVKTLLDTSHWASMMCFLTWETSGTPRNRLLFQLSPSEPYTAETGYSLLPTPTKSDGNNAPKNRYLGSKTYRSNFKEAIRLSENDGTLASPEYTEWVMGFPISWTELDPLEMQLSHSKSIPS